MRTKRRIGTLIVATAVLGWHADTGLSQSPIVRQCYRIQGIDPIEACTICMWTCLGEGYTCCTFSG
jgi:hypothetical protein